MSDLASGTRTFRSSLWRSFAIVWAIFVVVVVVDIARRGFPAGSWVGLAWVALLTAMVWCSSWRPLVTYDLERVEVRNPLRTAKVPWNAITRIDAADTLRIHTKSKIVRAWAAARGGAVANLARTARRPGGATASAPEQAALHELARRSPIDYAVEILREVWQQRKGETTGEIEIRWAIPEVAALVVTAAVAVIATVLN